MKRCWLSTIILLALMQQVTAQAPVAIFSSNRQSGCAPLGVAFRDESTGTPKYWSWDFGNGEFSNLQNPTITYAVPGTYNVTLTVRNGDGTHAVTKTGYITVSTSPTANFTSSTTIACAPSAIQFTDRSLPNGNPITAWLWDFGDGTTSAAQNPSKTYTEPGFYTVSLRITSATGCVASRTIGRMIRITGGVTADFDFTAPATCRPPFNINFTNQTSGPGTLTYQWNFGNSTSSTQEDPSATYAAAGTYNVTLTARSQYGCSHTITKPVTLGSIPTNFNGPDTACLNTPVSFTDASGTTPASSLWDLGNGTTSDQSTATATYTTAGIYNIKLVNTYGNCKDSLTKPLVIVADPAVDFTATGTTGCKAPQTTNFQAAAPAAISWRWDFGDGSSSTAQNPSHTYTTEGDFNVTLTITNKYGCTNTTTKSGFVSIKKPQVRFANAPTGGCEGFSFSARAIVVAPDGVASYAWDFGNGQTRTGATPSPVVYNTEGKYNLTLTVVTNGGCSQTITLPEGVKVGKRKTASFTASSTDVCVSELVRFTNTTADTDEWLWDFGDGTTSDLFSPNYRFKDTCNITVQLIAYDKKCPSLPVTAVIHNKPPLPSFNYSVDCAVDGEYTFVSTSKVNPLLPSDYTWDFGDGTTRTGQFPGSKIFAAQGFYNVTLTVTNGTCTNQETVRIHNAKETADFSVSPAPACTNSPVELQTINSDPANINQYQWALYGGPYLAGNRSRTIHVNNPGTYNVRLRILDSRGCPSVSSKSIVINGPIANFSPSVRGECRNRAVTFNDRTTSAVRVVEWIYDFGDGTTTTFTAPPFTHTYTDTGVFVVKLTAVDEKGCRGNFTSDN